MFFGLEIIYTKNISHIAEQEDFGVQYRTACGKVIWYENLYGKDEQARCAACFKSAKKFISEWK